MHQRISNHLRQQIEIHSLKPGDKLPSEKELCDQFNVSRITVRKSLSELHALGLIHSIAGKGTFVSLPQIKAPLFPLSSFTSDMERRGMKVSSRVLFFRIIQADIKIAEKFRINPGTEIVRLDRVRLLLPDEIPVAIQKVLLLYSRSPDILSFDLSSNSLYEILLTHYGLVYDRVETIITTRMSNAEENGLFRLKKTIAILQQFQTAFLTTGEIIEVSDSVYRPDLYQFEVIMEGGNAAFKK